MCRSIGRSAARLRILLPVPMMNIINGGERMRIIPIDIQEFMIMPVLGRAQRLRKLRCGAESVSCAEERIVVGRGG